MQEKVRNKLFFANKDSKTAKIRQTKTNPCKIYQIRQKSARNWETTGNIFCPPEDFQIRQNFANLAEKTAVWQRWHHHNKRVHSSCQGGHVAQRSSAVSKRGQKTHEFVNRELTLAYLREYIHMLHMSLCASKTYYMHVICMTLSG
jgi:hypothetical protein